MFTVSTQITMNTVAQQKSELTSVLLRAKISSACSLMSLANVEMPQMLLLTKLIKRDACSVLLIRVLPALWGLAELFSRKENISPPILDEIQCLGGRDCETFCVGETSADLISKRQVSVSVCLLWGGFLKNISQWN